MDRGATAGRGMVDAELLGGVIVRIGDRIHDGSVRRRMTRLRRQLLAK